jgi:hypothetical protein
VLGAAPQRSPGGACATAAEALSALEAAKYRLPWQVRAAAARRLRLLGR